MSTAATAASAAAEGNLPYGTYDIDLGGNGGTYHTLKIDFKPKSVGELHEIYIAESADQRSIQMAVAKETGEVATIYKGSSNSIPGEREYLMMDKGGGRLHLERLSTNIQLKKTRDRDEAALELFGSKIRSHKPTPSTSTSSSHKMASIVEQSKAKPANGERKMELDLLGEISDSEDSSSSSSSDEAAEAIEKLVGGPAEPAIDPPPSSVSSVHNDLYMSESGSSDSE